MPAVGASIKLSNTRPGWPPKSILPKNVNKLFLFYFLKHLSYWTSAGELIFQMLEWFDPREDVRDHDHFNLTPYFHKKSFNLKKIGTQGLASTKRYRNMSLYNDRVQFHDLQGRTKPR